MNAVYTLLKSVGWSPSRILDIGAYHGNWTRETKMYFPSAQYTLIEPNDNPNLRSLTDRILNEIVSDKQADVEWFSNGSTGDSIFRERTYHYRDVTPVIRKTTTLDTLFPEESFEFVKLDCQGAELSILSGGSDLISRTDAVVLECAFAGQYNEGAPTFAEYIQSLDMLGFAPLDIVEHHRASGLLIQIDIFFLRKTSPLWSKIRSIIR